MSFDGRPGRIENPGTASDATRVALQGTGPIQVQISVDNGRSWQPAGTGPGSIDLTRFVERRYGYQLKLILKPGSAVTGLRTDTYFQLAQAALPALARGATRMTFDLGDTGEMVEWDVPTWEDERAFAASAWKLDNVRWTEYTEGDVPLTPEVGTWLLLACTGLVGVVPRLRRRRK